MRDEGAPLSVNMISRNQVVQEKIFEDLENSGTEVGEAMAMSAVINIDHRSTSPGQSWRVLIYLFNRSVETPTVPNFNLREVENILQSLELPTEYGLVC